MSFFVDASALYALLDQLLPVVKIVDVDEGLRRRAIAAFRASVSSNVSLVDRTSFEFMRMLGLSRAYAFDADFESEGFELVS